jgi:sulfate adenylyltransferase (ADP) / ATP adenylyltransferase
MRLQKGMLWREIVRKTEHALSVGAILPLPTEYEFIEDHGIRFLVRILSNRKRKDEARKEQERTTAKSSKPVNPFLPYEEDLFISDISDTHVALLNKFNIVDHHLLIVTKTFEDQEMMLTPLDFKALWACMVEYNALGFYNAGEVAGASQPHKHLQMVPLPLAPEGPPVPIEPLLAKTRSKNRIGTIQEFPFRHVFAHIEIDLKSPIELARTTYSLYGEMLKETGLKPPTTDLPQKQSAPYCFLITRNWMLLVPRSREFFDSISINALGFSGALLVRDRGQMKRLIKFGPMTALKNVALSLT